MSVKFEWNGKKATLNLRKHGVGFEEASTVFNDPLALIFDDEVHSDQEHREIIIGHTASDRLVLVCFTEREEKVVRIISARSATRKEQNDYEENRGP